MARIAVIGGGPAGLMAAEVLSAEPGISVTVFDAMPSVGRKFLMAGKGGMNITHSEPQANFVGRYGERADILAPWLSRFGAAEVRAWIHGLGIETFVGTSGRVFPREMKAAPLLRAWLHRLRQNRVQFAVRHRWNGWSADQAAWCFSTPEGTRSVDADAVVLALGGGSWPQLGSNGAWVPLLAGRGAEVATLKPANCGFNVAWSAYFSERYAGQPIKPVIASIAGLRQQGEFNITASGVEGGLIYAVSAALREQLEREGQASLSLDLAPGRSPEKLLEELSRPRGRDSLANHLRRRAGIEGAKAGLLRELCTREVIESPVSLAGAIKSLPLPIVAPRPLAEAISTAGGLKFSALDERLMLRAMPGVFAAGEMLDWEAPTGGYLLTACLATGRAAAEGVLAWLAERTTG
ncbi:MAG: TIGR03862 family flavoprotein [Rhodocyclales bacterium GT-UBC]|nr:MAG: TIGR03862 family flavoprotein [Rhodocyclales bacterium GT-UBC]